jgi:hypothetical protein
MLTDHFMNENFFGGGEVSGNDLLGEWGRNLGLQSEAVAELVGDELLDIYMATGDAMESVKDAYEEGKETVGDALLAASNAYNEFLEAISAISLVKDPLIIDLSGDGLALSSQASSGVLFDMDGDGIAESTGWVTSDADGGDDVFLALDKNGNGNIDSVDELFGNDEMDGFAELSLYDSNSDNIIDVNDAQK